MARQGYDRQLTRYDERGWRATFYTSGMEHSPTEAIETAWERTPWQAVQSAALSLSPQFRATARCRSNSRPSPQELSGTLGALED
jgi:superfamily II helicase